MEDHRIGIPPQLMKGQKGERIPIEHWEEGLIVFNKPSSIASKADPWFAQMPDLESAFNEQISAGKPELEHHGITEIRVCNAAECECTGAVLASSKVETVEKWKNAFGSFRFTFHYLLITRKSRKFTPMECSLPLVRHFKNQRMFVSHNLGKKTRTQFTPICEGRTAEAWLASTRYPRLHQLRLHARESGIPLLRDPLYDPTYPPEMLEKNPFQLEWCHCFSIQASPELALEKTKIQAGPPKYWKRNLRKTGLEIDEVTDTAIQIIENITLPFE
jgi:23S rRNA-/tRNA-specific pseudouridylate synthase